MTTSEPPLSDAPDASAPVVDVVVPTLGDSPYVTETLDSVFAQTYPHWQLVVSENSAGSERMREVLEPYLADPRVRHVTTGERLHRADHWTFALRTGTAPYSGIVHDDDFWDPGFLERRVAFLEAHPECGFAFSPGRIVDGEGRVVGVTEPGLREGVHPPQTFLPHLYRDNVVTISTILVRRSAYQAVGDAYARVFFCDHEFWLRLAAAFPVGYLEGADAAYRLHAEQSSQTRRQYLGEHRVKLLDAVRQLPVPADVEREERARAHLHWTLDLVEQGKARDALSHLRTAIATDPRLLVEPRSLGRIGAGLGALATGGRGRATLAARRERRFQGGGVKPVG